VLTIVHRPLKYDLYRNSQDCRDVAFSNASRELGTGTGVNGACICVLQWKEPAEVRKKSVVTL
jgi:hypothetical protein